MSDLEAAINDLANRWNRYSDRESRLADKYGGYHAGARDARMKCERELRALLSEGGDDDATMARHSPPTGVSTKGELVVITLTTEEAGWLADCVGYGGLFQDLHKAIDHIEDNADDETK